jgi:hypothetical protein
LVGGWFVGDVEGRTSLAAVAFSEAGRSGGVDRVIVYVQETLLAADRGRRSGGHCVAVGRGYRPIHEAVGGGYARLLGGGSGPALRGSLGRWLHRAGVGVGSVEVAVAPGVGPFRYLDGSCSDREAVWRLEGGGFNMFSYYEAFLTLHLASRLLDPRLRGPSGWSSTSPTG